MGHAMQVAAGLVVNYWGEEICPANHHDVTNGGHDGTPSARACVFAVRPPLDNSLALRLGLASGCYNPNWRYPLFVQSFSIGLFAIYFTWVRGRFINAKGGREERIVHATKTIAQHEFRKYSDGNEYLQDHDMCVCAPPSQHSRGARRSAAANVLTEFVVCLSGFSTTEKTRSTRARAEARHGARFDDSPTVVDRSHVACTHNTRHLRCTAVRKWLGNAYRRNSAKKKKEAQDANADADAEQPTLEHHQHRRCAQEHAPLPGVGGTSEWSPVPNSLAQLGLCVILYALTGNQLYWSQPMSLVKRALASPLGF